MDLEDCDWMKHDRGVVARNGMEGRGVWRGTATPLVLGADSREMERLAFKSEAAVCAAPVQPTSKAKPCWTDRAKRRW